MREHIPRLQTYAKKFSPFPQRVALALQAEQASSQEEYEIWPIIHR